MNISKQIVDNQIRNLVKECPEYFVDCNDDNHKIATGFLLLSVSSYLNVDIQSAYQYLTDGGNDGGFDAAYIDDNNGDLNVILFQAKYTLDLNKEAAFPDNAIEKAVNVIRYIFDPGVSMSLNDKSQAVVDEIHSLIYAGKIPQVVFVCLNNGIMWNESGQTIINREFSGQKQVEFEYYNCDEIVANTTQKAIPDVDLHLSGPSIHEDFNYKSVIIGRVSVAEIANLMKNHGDGLLQKNIRYYLGSSKVNNQIKSTLLDQDDHSNFFFYNNGITIICDRFAANYLQKENWIVKLKNMQIINGGQTCRTIESVARDNPEVDINGAYVLVRIYQLDASDINMVHSITVATNSQNAVDLRDLRANDERQRLLVKGAEALGYEYKPKRDNIKSDSNVIPSSVCAEAVFAVWRKKPFLAKYHKSELFDKYYDDIYGKDNDVLNATQMIIAVKIFRYCDSERKKTAESVDKSVIRRYCSYLAATLVGQALLKNTSKELESITHKDFDELSEYFNNNKERLYNLVEDVIINVLKDYFSYMKMELSNIDGRTIASAFRSEEFCGSCIKRILE